MKFSKIINALITFTFLIGIFLICHSTESLAIRTHIFMEGHPLDAIGNAIPSCVITRKGFIYFASDYGSSNTP